MTKIKKRTFLKFISIIIPTFILGLNLKNNYFHNRSKYIWYLKKTDK